MLADAGQVGHHRDPERSQVIRRTDTRLHQELGAVEPAGAGDDLGPGARLLLLPVLYIFHADGPGPLEENARSRCAGLEGEVLPAALSEQRQVVCVGRSKRRPKRRLGREGAPLGQRGGAPLFVNLAGDEMALLIEMVVDLGMN